MLKIGIKVALVAMFLAVLPISCTKYNLIKTGRANGKHNVPMAQYFKGDPYNWSLTQELIAHADLSELFTQTGGEGFTFLGITNHSIRRYLFELQDKENREAEDEDRDPREIKVTDIPKAEAKAMLERCIIKGRVKLADIPAGTFVIIREKPDPDTFEEGQILAVEATGGKEYETLAGTKLWMYTFREPYATIPKAGPTSIYVLTDKSATAKRVKIASSDIETLTGIVHSLPYQEYTLGEL